MQVVKRSGLGPELADWNGDGFERLMRRMQSLMVIPEMATEAFSWTPRVDLVDAGDDYVMTAELPGVPKENVDITYEDGTLTLKGTKTVEKQETEKSRELWERSYGSFERSFSLPRMVDAERITADYRDGVVTIHLPKLEQAKGRRIEITSS